MPKLNDTHLPERIQRRITELEAGVEVDAKDIRRLLTPAQQELLEAAWAEQQTLRKGKRAVTLEQQQELGWKSKRLIHIGILKQALEAAGENLTDAYATQSKNAEIRQTHIYMKALGAAIDAGHDTTQARSQANNALTRAGLRRLDGQTLGQRGLSGRDKEIMRLEQELKQRAYKEMTADEREQEDIWAEHEKAVKGKQKKGLG